MLLPLLAHVLLQSTAANLQQLLRQMRRKQKKMSKNVKAGVPGSSCVFIYVSSFVAKLTNSQFHAERECNYDA
jgi:hypothetical protein